MFFELQTLALYQSSEILSKRLGEVSYTGRASAAHPHARLPALSSCEGCFGATARTSTRAAASDAALPFRDNSGRDTACCLPILLSPMTTFNPTGTATGYFFFTVAGVSEDSSMYILHFPAPCNRNAGCLPLKGLINQLLGECWRAISIVSILRVPFVNSQQRCMVKMEIFASCCSHKCGQPRQCYVRKSFSFFIFGTTGHLFSALFPLC